MEKWVKHLQAAGFSVETEIVQSLGAVEARRKVPRSVSTCHTAAVGGCIVEEHVPATVLALAMAATGLYGVKAYLVTRRRREIGIRLALGATPEGVVALIVKEGALLLGGGVAIGFFLALGAGRIVSRLLVGVRPLDPLVLFLATSGLTLAVLAASYVPARRATRVDPAVTLRDE